MPGVDSSYSTVESEYLSLDQNVLVAQVEGFASRRSFWTANFRDFVILGGAGDIYENLDKYNELL